LLKILLTLLLGIVQPLIKRSSLSNVGWKMTTKEELYERSLLRALVSTEEVDKIMADREAGTPDKCGKGTNGMSIADEIHILRFGGVIEIMTRNPNVDSFVREKEAQIDSLTARVAGLEINLNKVASLFETASIRLKDAEARVEELEEALSVAKSEINILKTAFEHRDRVASFYSKVLTETLNKSKG